MIGKLDQRRINQLNCKTHIASIPCKLFIINPKIKPIHPKVQISQQRINKFVENNNIKFE